MRIDGVSPLGTGAQAANQVDPKLHDAALQFEQLLVRQLTQVLADSAKPGDEEDGSAAASFYADQLPDALASAIKDAGGLGLADELVRAARWQS